MSSILEQLAGQLGGSRLREIGSSLGTDEKTAEGALGAALPLLMGALSRNSTRGDGAQSLLNALEKDHDGSVLDNLSSVLGNPESGPGEGILRHVLGNRRPAVESSLGKASGMDAGKVGKLLTMLAPIVMGALGKAKRNDNLDASGLASLLGGERKRIEQREPQAAGILGTLLDSDGDGDVDLGDILKRGKGLMGALFGGK